MANSIIAQSLQTMEISTGNVATVNDAYVSNVASYNGPQAGALNPLGGAMYLTDTSARRLKYRYVRLNCTAPPTFIVGPVYWKDNTYTVVTALSSEALYGINSFAGVLLNVNATNGNYVFIQTAGHLGGVVVAASTAAGDAIIPATGTQLFGRTAANTAPTNIVAAWAETAIASLKSDINICVEQ
jgi:hypothetical protein